MNINELMLDPKFDLEKYIENKDKKIDDLQNRLENEVATNILKCKEIERLNNIINELEKYIKTEAKVELYGDKTGLRTFADVNDILNKLKELKEGEKND